MDDVTAKVITLIILLLLSMLFGCLPYFIVLRGTNSFLSNRTREVLLACLNCFAGGVFLGTFLLHLMTEGAEEFENYKTAVNWDTDFPFFNTFVFGGLILVALLEHFMHTCLHHDHSHEIPEDSNFNQTSNHHSHTEIENHESQSNQNQNTSLIQQQENRSRYGTIDPHHNHENRLTVSFEKGSPLDRAGNSFEDGACVDVRKPRNDCPPGPHCDPEDTHEGPEHLHHQAHGMQAFLLLMALSFHTIFDGLAVGLQKGAADVWAVFAGIAVHKSVIGFCLGFEMFKKYLNSPWKAFLWMFMFSLMSPFGIALGIGLQTGDINENAKFLSSSILQGVAAGVFLYVTFLEILCSYMGHSCIRGSKFIYYVSTGFGFGIMAFVKTMDAD